LLKHTNKTLTFKNKKNNNSSPLICQYKNIILFRILLHKNSRFVTCIYKNIKIIWFGICVIVISTGFHPLNNIDKISLAITSKTLKNGEYVVTKGEVFYRTSGGLLVTHFTSPIENIVITNANGELKIYDSQTNTVIMKQGRDYSSENSFIYYFLIGQTQDMGLKSSGFQLQDTKIENNLVITTWFPPAELLSHLSKAELVLENHQPVFMGFYNKEEKAVQKIFYSNFQKVGEINMPMNITEFQYVTGNDSVITKRVYSDVKINEKVDDTYLNFKIPSDAKIIK